MTGILDSLFRGLEDLAGEDWLVVPLPEDVRGKPKRWANSTTYRLFPWYVRPFKTVEMVATAASLETLCRMSSSDLRFAAFLSQVTSITDTTTVAVATTDELLVGPGRAPADGLRTGTGTRWGEAAKTWPFMDATGAVVARRWQFRSGSSTITVTGIGGHPAAFAAAETSLKAFARRIRSAT
ncbi:hypothetical protein ABC270_00195 [Curtobacterium sp. 1P10AnD]|uniref:hypothetical protein n=1 Tax=Curtobacterium sp. 1P10AnD TaxID=3132283 RepID=UPI0039A1CF72